MLNATGGVLRVIARLRPTDRDFNRTVSTVHRRAVRITRRLVDRLTPVPSRSSDARVVRATSSAPRHLVSHRSSGTRRPQRGMDGSVGSLQEIRARLVRRLRLDRRLLSARLRSERTLPMAIAIVVIITSVVSLGPAAVRTVGAAQGSTQDLRLAIGGGLSEDPALDAPPARAKDLLGTYIEDGTFYKPVAVDTTVESGSSLLQHYAVRSGDSLTGIASQFGVSMMTLWWANHLTTKDALHIGQVLLIPPVNGLVVTVQVGDTLDALAAQYKVNAQAILDLNELTDPSLVVGQILIMPGAKGAPIPTAAPTPTPTPTPRPAPRTTSRSTSSSGSRTFVPTSGSWAWPVVGGGNYISQSFHYGHYGVDIAAQYGTKIVSPRAGTVVFAGWWGTGGYQVWINHGSGIYSMHCHMSAVTVSVGQSVGKGQQIGRVGMSGDATGPHDHFAVSIGYPFRGGSYFVNPLRYY